MVRHAERDGCGTRIGARRSQVEDEAQGLVDGTNLVGGGLLVLEEGHDAEEERLNAGQGSELMTVGELSRRTGVSTKNLRAYTDQGLIYSVGRTAANYRLYDVEALWCVAVITELRQLGLTVAEIDEFVRGSLARDGGPIGPRLARMLELSRTRIERQIAELEEVRGRIDAFVDDHQSELGDTSARSWPGDPRPRDSRP